MSNEHQLQQQLAAALMVAESGNALVKQLKDQLAAIQAENEDLQNELHDALEDIEREMRKVRDLNEAGLKLQAENERLRSAGDAMMGWIDRQHDDSGYPHSEAWLAAKGVQS
jgi:chromosome segregation ATPase